MGNNEKGKQEKYPPSSFEAIIDLSTLLYCIIIPDTGFE